MRSLESTPQRELTDEIHIPESVVISSDTDEEMDRRQASATVAIQSQVQPREEPDLRALLEDEREWAMMDIFGDVSDTDEDRQEESSGKDQTGEEAEKPQ